MKISKFYSRFAGLILIMMTGISAVFAGGDIYVRLLEDNSKAMVIYSNTEETMFSLSIENQDETVNYYTDRFNKLKKYKKLFDFSRLEDGIYYFIVEIDNERIVRRFTVRDSKVILDDNLENEEVKLTPYFRQNGNYLYCYYSNSDEANIAIRFSSDRSIFFEDEITSNLVINKKYDLTQLPKGSYTAILAKGSDEYNYNFKVEK